METRVKKYKQYRKQINKEHNLLLKSKKNDKELSKLEYKLSKLDKSLIDIEEVNLFSIETIYDDEWPNYLLNVKELISFYDLNEISKLLLLVQNPTKETYSSKKNSKELISSFINDDLNYKSILKIKKKVKEKIDNQEDYKRYMKDINNHVEKMIIDCKKVRVDEPYIKNIINYSDEKSNKYSKIFYIFISIFFLLFLFIGIVFLILGGYNNAL